jgi:hypothetical protein
MPLRAEPGTSVEAEAARLVATIREKPAPWMRRALADEACDGPADPADPTGPCSCESGGKGCCS